MGRKKGRKKRLARLAILLSILFITWYLLGNHRKNNKINLEQLLPSPKVNSTTCQEYKIPNNSPGLEQAIQSELIGTNGTYGIIVKNIKTNEFYSQNPKIIFDSESLYKLWVMTIVYNHINQGKLKENQILNDTYANLNKYFHIDSKIAEKTKGSFSIKVNDALKQMITVSDNYSALILTKQIGLITLQEFLKKNCFINSKAGIAGKPPTTSSSDIAYFYEKLYQNKLSDKITTEKMIGLLKAQKFISKIPKYLPYTIQLSVAHKTGELEPYSHDGGIVYDALGDYIIVVMSKSDSRDLANERIANVSKAVFFYFNPRSENLNASSSAN